MPDCIFYYDILYLFAIYNLALEDSSALWIFLVFMLLKIKSLLTTAVYELMQQFYHATETGNVPNAVSTCAAQPYQTK